MFHSNTNSKRYQLILMPPPHHRFNSLKGSHSFFHHQQQNLTKRHSLDSRPSQNLHKNSSYVENAEEFTLGNKNWGSKQIHTKAPRSPFDDHVKVKYFWRAKNGKSHKKDEKSKVKKVKRTWSELGKHFNKK